MSATLQRVSSAKRTRRYGLPFRGYKSSVPAHQCPENYAWGQNSTAGTPGSETSFNMIYDPQEGKFFRRAGSTPIGGTSGLLESATWEVLAKPRQLIALQSPSIEDLGAGYPTHCVLFTQESATAANNKSGLYVRSTVGSINYTLGQEFNASNHYPGTTAATFNIKCIPYYRTTDGSWGRLATAATRQLALAGSRGMQLVGDWLYFGCKDSIPLKWNKRYNESTSSGSQNLRLMPVGGMPPLGSMTLTEGPSSSHDGAWQIGDIAMWSVAYQYADGSVGPPTIPRDLSDTLTLGFNFKEVLANACDYITISNIPVGPDGVVGRWILRTPKFNATQSVGTYPSVRDLRTTAYIGNNSTTSYRDYNSNDLSLKDRPDIIRFDRIWQPPARYIGNFDGRNIVGYTKANPAAIVLCPRGSSNALTLVTDDDASLITTSYEYDVGVTTAGKLTIKSNGSTTAQYTVSSTVTIQQLVDQINEYNQAWLAQIVPGADAEATTDNLALTTSINTGDTSGRARAFSASYPGVLYFSTTYLSQFPTAKNRWFFTQGGPDVPANLADSYLAGNYRTGAASWGNLMGFAPLSTGCAIFFAKAIILFDNRTTGKFGQDEDYHPRELFTDLGCIAWDSIVWGNGWAGCLTEQGFFVFDNTGRRRNISVDLWNAATQTGEWSYEIPQCAMATAADNDSAHFHAEVLGNKIRCDWRSGSGVTIPNRYSEYDFSLSASEEGIGQVLRPDGSPWGWSAPSGLSMSVMGEVRTASGVARYGCIESVSTGRVDQFETGTQDNGSAIAGDLWGPIDFSESLSKKAAQEARLVYKVNGSGATIRVNRTDGVTTETGSALALPTTGSGGTFKELPIALPQTLRTQATGHQYRISDDGAGGALEVWGHEMDVIEGSRY